MIIHRLSLAEGVQAARGTVVIVDVFRSVSTEPLIVHCGASRVILESDIEKCRAMRGSAVLIGELNELPIEGFHLTNSPYLVMVAGATLFEGRTVVHRTTAGVVGALAALDHADEVLMASFVTARATADYLRRRQPERVSIVGLGIRSRLMAPEDEHCCDYIESLLTEGRRYDHVAACKDILNNETSRKFLRGDKAYLPREDPLICLQRDLFDFALRAERRGEVVEAVPIRPDA